MSGRGDDWMDGESAIEEGAAPGLPEDAPEYELEAVDTEDLDEALREAVEAVERSESAVEKTIGRGGATAADEIEESDVARLQAELADLRDRSVRTMADFENYRKRVARERSEERRYAALELARDILAVVDNLERALSAEGSAEDLKQGVDLIHRQLDETLRRHGVHRVASVGEPFDPSLHEAVARFEDPELAAPTVSEEMQSGYLLHDRLLRPAMVKVALPATGEEREEDAADVEPEAD
jgi:molecular chaperone GrpE